MTKNLTNKRMNETKKLQNQQKITQKALKGTVKMESKQFKFKGNQIQYDFNLKLTNDIEEAIDLVKEGSISRSSKLLTAMKSEVIKRNKLIKMADRSLAGWSTVEEYLSDKLSSNSDDEKRIKSAESKALAKKKAKGNQKSHYGSRYNPLARPMLSSSPPIQNHSQIERFGFPRETAQPSGNSFQRHQTQPFGGTPRYRLQNHQRPTICYGCGIEGHWRKDCANGAGQK